MFCLNVYIAYLFIFIGLDFLVILGMNGVVLSNSETPVTLILGGEVVLSCINSTLEDPGHVPDSP